MFYAIVSLPGAAAEQIERFRRKYDPTADLLEAHLTVVFPVPGSLGRSRFIAHCEQLLQGRQAFPVTAAGFSKSPDHYLFLDVTEGASAVHELYLALNVGILSKYARPDLFRAHISLGAFLKPGARYDWDHPDPDSLDEDRYSRALREATDQRLGASWVLDRLELIEIPDEALSWATGQLPCLPESLRARRTHTFPLQHS